MVQGGAVPALFVFVGRRQQQQPDDDAVQGKLRSPTTASTTRPGHLATGRFSNGHNLADFMAYRSISNTTENYSIFLNGFNFASGGAGVLDITNKVSVYEGLVQKLGKNHASIHLARSIFAVGTGGNDIATCVLTDPTNQLLVCSDQQFINSLAKSLERFAEVKSACCGLGDNTAQLICMPMNTLCANRRNHIFWDGGHLTEITTEKLAGVTFNGSVPLVSPVNLKQLTAL
ncbi:hypothetical protein SETIT_9G181000v2 [Setaria italica]|uniref:SGNH hydrolase-type esterase domain-containing protein n=1 Tax=Setaria italica TaxID=4555 RepID=A0A368SHW1_SETIT|nr:hypothetical protein SETIT_9G181000v2 [Setaria italica]